MSLFQYSQEELCAAIDWINTFECFKNNQNLKNQPSPTYVKSFQDFTDGWHIQTLLYIIDKQFFEDFLKQKKYIFPSAETAAEKRINLKILVDGLIEYYQKKLSIDLLSPLVHQQLKQENQNNQINISINSSTIINEDPLLFFKIEKLVQTESGFGIGECEAMMQLFVFIFAILMTNDSLKSAFIEPILSLQEDIQEPLQNVIQQSILIMQKMKEEAEFMNDSNIQEDSQSQRLQNLTSQEFDYNHFVQEINQKEQEISQLKKENFDLHQSVEDSNQKVEEMQESNKLKDQELIKLRNYINNFEQEHKKLQNQLLDEKLQKEEALKQIESYEDVQKQTDRVTLVKKNIQNNAIKKLESEIEQKDYQIIQLKQKINKIELQAIQKENSLKDELDLLKEKINQLMQCETTLEIYKTRVKEIPELKIKLKNALKQIMDLEQINEKNEVDKNNTQLNEILIQLKKQIYNQDDKLSKNEIEIAKLQNELKDCNKQNQLKEQTIQQLQKSVQELKSELQKKQMSLDSSIVEEKNDNYQLIVLENQTLIKRIQSLEKKQKNIEINKDFVEQFKILQDQLEQKDDIIAGLKDKIFQLEFSVQKFNQQDKKCDCQELEQVQLFAEKRENEQSQKKDLKQQLMEKSDQIRKFKTKSQNLQEKIKQDFAQDGEIIKKHLVIETDQKSSVKTQETPNFKNKDSSNQEFSENLLTQTLKEQNEIKIHNLLIELEKREKEIFNQKQLIQTQQSNYKKELDEMRFVQKQSNTKLESQHEIITNLKREQRIMAGVLHRIALQHVQYISLSNS